MKLRLGAQVMAVAAVTILGGMKLNATMVIDGDGQATLQELHDNPNLCLAAGDKLFCDFSGSTLVGVGIFAPPDMTGVNVRALLIGGIPTLKLDGLFTATGVGGGPNPSTLDVKADFHVWTDDGVPRILGVGLSMAGLVVGGTGVHFASVGETVHDEFPDTHNGSIFCSTAACAGPGENISTFIGIHPSAHIHVIKDIGLFAFGMAPADFASISISDVTQVFNQRPDDVIPEPATFVLMGAGLLGLALFRRNRG